MKITVEQLQELIFEEEQIKEIAQKQSDQLDYDASVELMERVMNAFPIQPEEREKVSRLDRIIYAVRGAYIFGYMSAVDTLNDAYDTGRVQGMREERAKRKERYNG